MRFDVGVFLFIMSIKNQGTELNRTVTDFLADADFGSFGNTYLSVILKGDAGIERYITGFSWNWIVGIAADVNVNHFSNVFLYEGILISPDTQTLLFPDLNSKIRFAYGQTMPQFSNSLDKQLLSPFKLLPGLHFSLVATIQKATGLTATSTGRLTVFGFEKNEHEQKQTYYAQPR